MRTGKPIGTRSNRGTSLVELMVVMALFSVITTVLVLFYRIANVEFEVAASNMNLAQASRLISEKMLPYASTAIPKDLQQAVFIYSPTSTAMTYQADPAVIPNIYCLDFVTACDFLSPAGGSFDSVVDNTLAAADQFPSMANIRGTGRFYRYRIRYDVPTLKLWLERVADNALTTGALPAQFNTGTRPAKLLGSGINSVEFMRVDNSINVRISMTTLLRTRNPNGTAVNSGFKSRWFQGQSQRNLSGQSKDGTGGVANKVTELVTYTTVLLPVYTGK